MNSQADLRSIARSGTVEIAPFGAVAFRDLAELGDRIGEIVRGNRYAHLAQPIPEAEFEAVSRRLGNIDLRTDLVVDERRHRAQRESRTQQIGGERPGVYQSAGLDFHTDRPTADVLAWYCVVQDAVDGTSILLDASGLQRALEAEELDALTRVRVWYTLRDPDTDEESSHQASLLTPRDDGYEIYYAPWLIAPDPDGDEIRSRALDRLARWIDRKQSSDCLRIRLRAGECLFIDNRRMLHGRSAVAADSRRHLVRLYLSTREP